MQTLITTSTALSTECAIVCEQNFQPIEENPSDLDLDTNLDSSTLAILEEIEAERDYYQTCGRW